MDFLILSNQKLWRCGVGEEPRELVSPFAQDFIARAERQAGLRGWVAGGRSDDQADPASAMNRAMVWGAQGRTRAAVVARFTEVVADRRGGCWYFVDLGAVRGLFHQDAAGRETRLFHRNDLAADGFDWHPEREQFVFAGLHGGGFAHLALMDRQGRIERWLTEGDTSDARPSWDPSRPGRVLYQSAGFNRAEDGRILGLAPSAVMALDIDRETPEVVWQQDGVDLLLPRADREGRLYALARPAEARGMPWWRVARETALIPVRLGQAVFGFLNAFSLLFGKQPLWKTDGTHVFNEPSPPAVTILGRRLKVAAQFARQRKTGGRQPLAPNDWTLVRRDADGAVQTLARNVSWYALAPDDTPYYTTGDAIHAVNDDSAEIQWRGLLVETFSY